LIYRGIWEQQNNQHYADLFFLIKQGVPPKLRLIIWNDLLKVQLLEYEEKHKLERLGRLDLPHLSVYQNYKALANKEDCLSFRQIDEDVDSFQFESFYL